MKINRNKKDNIVVPSFCCSVIGTPRRKEEKKENSVDDEKCLSVMLDDSCSRYADGNTPYFVHH